jgi:hypothetical protein
MEILDAVATSAADRGTVVDLGSVSLTADPHRGKVLS